MFVILFIVSFSYFIYIISSYSGVLYIGVTNNLRRRIYEHKNELVEGFSKKYKCKKLVYFEEYQDINLAIAREKQLKNWNRKKKEWLIKQLNPDFKDLSENW
ncbi:MAG: GIY-YIG nuclease family protein [Patescibacteria group bacterium]